MFPFGSGVFVDVDFVADGFGGGWGDQAAANVGAGDDDIRYCSQEVKIKCGICDGWEEIIIGQSYGPCMDI